MDIMLSLFTCHCHLTFNTHVLNICSSCVIGNSSASPNIISAFVKHDQLRESLTYSISFFQHHFPFFVDMLPQLPSATFSCLESCGLFLIPCPPAAITWGKVRSSELLNWGKTKDWKRQISKVLLILRIQKVYMPIVLAFGYCTPVFHNKL